MKHPTICRLSMATVGITLSLLAMGDADAYTFSHIFDDSSPYHFDDSPSTPAINNQGIVAFHAKLDLVQHPLPISDPYFSFEEDYFRDVIFTGDGKSLNRITQGLGAFELEDINDSNTIAFKNEKLTSHNTTALDLLTTNDGTLTTINRGPSDLAYTYGDVVINNKGNVVFLDVGYEHYIDLGWILVNSIVTSDGVNRTTIAENDRAFPPKYYGESLALNDKGNVAFEAVLNAGSSGIFIGNGDSTIPIADTNGQFSGFGDLSLNDADTLAFAAFLDDGSQGIFTNQGDLFTTIVDTSGSFSKVSHPAINNNGTVAFQAQLDTGEYGIFTGSDPVTDKIIAIGDPLFGSTVTSLVFSNKGFNDAGQVAFFAKLANGSSGIFRADPEPATVPEPGTGLGLFVISTIGAGAVLRHKQK